MAQCCELDTRRWGTWGNAHGGHTTTDTHTHENVTRKCAATTGGENTHTPKLNAATPAGSGEEGSDLPQSVHKGSEPLLLLADAGTNGRRQGIDFRGGVLKQALHKCRLANPANTKAHHTRKSTDCDGHAEQEVTWNRQGKVGR
jgi:hypothetical protein